MFNNGIITESETEFRIEHKNGLCHETTFDLSIEFEPDIQVRFLFEFKVDIQIELGIEFKN